MKKSIIAIIAGGLLLTGCQAYAASDISVGGYVEQDTDSALSYGVQADYKSAYVLLEGFTVLDNSAAQEYYATFGISDTADLGSGFTFTPTAEYAVSMDKDLAIYEHAAYFQGMVGYDLTETVSARAGAGYRFSDAFDDQVRLKAGLNYQISETLNADYDYEYRAGVERGELFTNTTARQRHEVSFSTSSFPIVEPYFTIGRKTYDAAPADTYAIVGFGFGF